jgi:hypothetical protein
MLLRSIIHIRPFQIGKGSWVTFPAKANSDYLN